MARRTAALTLTSLLLVTSCASSPGLREPWVYAISRAAYSDDWSSQPIAVSSGCHSESEAVGWVVILLLPFAVDTVLLPITVPHDLVLVR
jgi:hypothetical protein